MQNVVKRIFLFLFLFLIHVVVHICYCYKFEKLGDPFLNNRNFSNALINTYRKVNKYINNENRNYDTCIYKKIPKILTEHKKPEKSPIKYIVGIENTCDDTCICVIDTNLNILINVIISHFKIVHTYSGVYPFFISSINKLFLKQYVDSVLDKIDTNHITCYGFSVCPGIAKNMEAAKEYINEKIQKPIQISTVNHIFAHILSPLFFPFYNDNSTYTNCSEYKEIDLNKIEKQNTIHIDISNAINTAKTTTKDNTLLCKKEIHNILKIINNNDTTKKIMNKITEKDFYKYASYTLRKQTSIHEFEKENIISNNDKKKENELFEKYEAGYLKDGYICVLVSGGSTEIYKIGKQKEADICVQKIAKTVDISIGDIIDKLSRTLLLPVGVGGGYFLEKKAEQFLNRLQKNNLNVEDYEDPFQPFPFPFSDNNVINFSFSGIYNHMRKVIERLKGEQNFEEEKDRYAYFCQKNIFAHLLKQLNKIMYFSELHFNIKNMCIVGGVGCNQFLYRSLKNLAKNRNTEEQQIKEYKHLKKRIKKKIEKLKKMEQVPEIEEKEKNEKINIIKSNTPTDLQSDIQSDSKNNVKESEIELTASLSWKFYLKYIMKMKKKEDILSAFNSFNFETFSKLKRDGCFLLNHLDSSNSFGEWRIYRTPLNLSKDNAAMVCFNTFLNLWNNTNIHKDVSSIKIKQTVNTMLENLFVILSDIIVFDVFLNQLK